ncbi:fibronectin type III domain-containing protein [Paenibacillus motobuensis]|uniref:fibronectin type III domain-containing protein n=1 Tax=Paenibacillus TaxID=44249 RepID=UPI002040EA51|nr:MULTISPECIES: fibronectin type III domain-containing protein [Paenibacillus]MCM3039975.1 fibronectin type III domain-containing protein [Paenibacillus lutimineralis]MCM3647079.1 fibronectin type III domain-containing protein [Paenibacillus motobuensis]
MRIFAREIGKRVMPLLLAFTVLLLQLQFQFQDRVFAEGAAAAVPLAKWEYTENPTDLGVFPATNGVYKSNSNLQPIPSRQYYDWNEDNKSIRYQGWHRETGKDKYWLVNLSTKNYQKITLSSAQQGKGTTGPRDFRVQISTDQQNWINITGDGTAVADVVLNPDTPSVLEQILLPAAANDQEQLYIRWIVISDKSTSGSTIGDRGSSQLIDITVQGEFKGSTSPSGDTEAPTVPKHVTASSIGSSEVQLSWADSTDNTTVAGYNIYRNGIKIGSSSELTYTDSGLAASTVYQYTLTAFDAANNESAPSPIVEVATFNEVAAQEKVLLAEWVFANSGSGGVFPATGGILKASSNFRNVGGYYEYYDSSQHSISYQGWDNGNGAKYWLASLSTKGYKNITLSSQQTSSGTGPRDFKVQFSSDNQTWTDVPGTSLKMVQSSFNCSGDTCKLADKPLPVTADNQDTLYIRWVVQSNTNTKGTQGIGSTGSSLIKDIRLSGTVQNGEGPVDTPTVELSKSPNAGDSNVLPSVPVTVKFNKPISLNTDHNVSIVDQNNAALSSVTAEIINNDTLNIKHPAFAGGKIYTVKVPKELIKGRDDQIQLTKDIVWSFTIQNTQGTPTVPKLINMTLNGDTKTSRSFAWYTDATAASVVQVVEAAKASGGSFPESEALTFQGSTEEIQTYVTKADRTAKKKKKFYNHKVTATGLLPGTKYKYRVGSGLANSWSEIGSFTTDAQGNEPFHFITGSDSQASSKSGFEPWADTFKKAVQTVGEPKFLINAGDLVDNGDLEEQWQWILGLPQEQLLNVPIVPVVGGHEVQDYDGDETTPNSNFYYHFNLPKQVVANTHDGSVYSFEYGNALFLIFNSQYDGELASNGKDIKKQDQQFVDQVEWMKYIVAKSDAKWKFVTFHKGPYSAGDNAGEWEDDRVQFYKKVLVPAFDEMGIDMVFEAHDHMYMRSYQMLNDKVIPPSQITLDAQGNAVNPKGTIYLMSNSFGDKFYNKYPGYNDYFAAIDTQPNKKMFTDVSVSADVLQIKAYTAAKKDESSGSNGVKLYDQYGIKRTDSKPAKVENAKAQVSGGKVVISWKAPTTSSEPVRGYRIYEKNSKIKAYWNVYVGAESGKTDYSYTVNNANTSEKYQFVIRAVGSRINSDPVEVSVN